MASPQGAAPMNEQGVVPTCLGRPRPHQLRCRSSRPVHDGLRREPDRLAICSARTSPRRLGASARSWEGPHRMVCTTCPAAEQATASGARGAGGGFAGSGTGCDVRRSVGSDPSQGMLTGHGAVRVPAGAGPVRPEGGSVSNAAFPGPPAIRPGPLRERAVQEHAPRQPGEAASDARSDCRRHTAAERRSVGP